MLGYTPPGQSVASLQSFGTDIIIDPRMSPYNAKADLCVYTGGSISSGALTQLVLPSILGKPSAYTVGNCIRVANAGAAGVDLVTTIAGWNAATKTITLAAPADATALAALVAAGVQLAGEFGTDDSAAINAALAVGGFTTPWATSGSSPTTPPFAPGNEGFWQFGKSRVTLKGYSQYDGGFAVSSPIRLPSGATLVWDGAAVVALGNFAGVISGEGVISQIISGGVLQPIFDSYMVCPHVIVNGNADVGIWMSLTANCGIVGKTRVYGARKVPIRVGPLVQANSYDRTICFSVGDTMELYGNAYTAGVFHANDTSGVGLHFTQYSYDNTISGHVYVLGYYTGYWDQGGNNKLTAGLHAWTGKNGGYMQCAAKLDGGNFSIQRIYMDSPCEAAGVTVYGALISQPGYIGEIASTINPSVGTQDNTVVLVQNNYSGAQQVHIDSIISTSIPAAKFKQVVSDAHGTLVVGKLAVDANYYTLGYTLPAVTNANAIATLSASTTAGFNTINATLPGAPWTPAQISNQLAMWFDARSGVTTAGTSVTAWLDKAAGVSASVASSSTSPTFNATGWDGVNPCITFDGAVSGNMLALGGNTSLKVSTDYTVFAVLKRRTQNTTETGRCNVLTLPVHNGSAGFYGELAFYPVSVDAGQTKVRIDVSGGGSSDNAGAGVSVGQIVTGFFTETMIAPGQTAVGISTTVDYSNTEHSSTNVTFTPGAVSASPVLLGGDTISASRRGAFDIAELVIVAGTISADLVYKMQGYLAAKWFGAVSSLLPSTHKYGTTSPTNPSSLTSFVGIDTPIFSLTANMNSTADQQFTLRSDLAGNFSSYQISSIRVVSTSGSCAAAVGGIYTAASKGGSAIVAAGQGYTDITATGLAERLTVSPAGLATFSGQTAPYLSLTTAQGAAATATILIYGTPLS